MEAMSLFEADTASEGETAIYEIGYHLLPTLSESDAKAAVKDLTDLLKKSGASIVGEKEPVKIDLAYTIQKRIGGRLTPIKETHFGWVAFELPVSELPMIKTFMDANTSVVRYLLISTTAEEVKAFLEGAVAIPTAAASTATISAPKRATEEGATISDEALTQALDTMAAEDVAKE